MRRVARDGTVTTLVAGLEGRLARPAILPNGYLALGSHYGDTLLLLDMGLTPVPLHGGFGGGLGWGSGGGGSCGGGGGGMGMMGAMGMGRTGSEGWLTAAAVELSRPPRTLFGDLGALLDAQPDDTSDLVIRVGERRFHCHRLILSTRCDYFKQRLAAGGGFADARAAELELPDADADAFALLLRWLYTGGAAIPPALALAVAELADRLLLPELCLAAQGRLMSGVQPSTIATALLWADARAPASVRLRVELKAW